MYKILTLNKISKAGLSLFGDGFTISPDHKNPEAIIVRSQKVDTDNFKNLLCVCRAGSGYNNITVDNATKKGICVFNTPGANANAVAELIFIALGCKARNIIDSLGFVNSLKNSDDSEITKLVEKEKSKFKGSELFNKKLSVLGLGKIGVKVANIGVSKGMNVLAFDPFISLDNMHQLRPEVNIAQSLEELFSFGDVVTIHVALTENTKNLVSKNLITKMHKGAVLLNYSRGAVVDDKACVKALDNGTLDAYLTDFPTSEYIAHPKVLCTPHLGASTAESEDKCAVMAVDQIKEYLLYGTVVNSVNFPMIEIHPASNIKTRAIIIYKDQPGMISKITSIFGKYNINIESMRNESKEFIGYNISDSKTELPKSLVDELKAVPDVIMVRTIKF